MNARNPTTTQARTTTTLPPSAAAAAHPLVPQGAKHQGLVAKMAARYTVDPDKLLATLKATAFKQPKKPDGTYPEVTNEQMMALLVVADGYGLNPFTREIYAFGDSKTGGIVPIVSIDGWLRIINERPEMASLEIRYHGFEIPKGDPEHDPFIEVTIQRRDRTAPITVREYMEECWRDTGPWNSHPRRMLRHKTIVQCGRVAFGFAGIYDPDEAERIRDAGAIDVVATEVVGKPKTHAPQARIEGPPPVEASAPAQASLVEPPTEGQQRHALRKLCDKMGVGESTVLEKFELDGIDLDDLPVERIPEATAWLNSLHG
jgi:phage recombination protein Bet